MSEVLFFAIIVLAAVLIIRQAAESGSTEKNKQRRYTHEYHSTTPAVTAAEEHSEGQVDIKIRNHIKVIQNSLKRSEVESATNHGIHLYCLWLDGAKHDDKSQTLSSNAQKHGSIIGDILCLSARSINASVKYFLHKNSNFLEIWEKEVSGKTYSVSLYLGIWAAKFLALAAVEFDLDRKNYFLTEVEDELQEYLINISKRKTKTREEGKTQTSQQIQQDSPIHDHDEKEDPSNGSQKPPNKLFGISKGDLISNYKTKPLAKKHKTHARHYQIENTPSPHSKLVDYYCQAFDNGEIHTVRAHSKNFNLAKNDDTEKQALTKLMSSLVSQLQSKYGEATTSGNVDTKKGFQLDIDSDPFCFTWNFGDKLNPSRIVLGCELLERFTESSNSIIRSEMEGINDLIKKGFADKVLTTKDQALLEKYYQRKAELEKLNGLVYVYVSHEFDYPISDYIADAKRKKLLEDVFDGNSNDRDAL